MIGRSSYNRVRQVKVSNTFGPKYTAFSPSCPSCPNPGMLRAYIGGATRPVAIKYRREGFHRQPLGAENRYEVRTRFTMKDPRRRLLIIYVGICVVSILLLASHFMFEIKQTDWLPERTGQGVVIEKRIQREGTPDARYVLIIRISVPPADPIEADMLPPGQPDRERALGPLELTDPVTTTEEDWRSIASGVPVRVRYRIDTRRTRVLIENVEVETQPSRSETPGQGLRSDRGNIASAMRVWVQS